MTRTHKNWIHNYVAELTPRGEAPERFHYWVAAVTIAGALRRRVYIEMNTFRWYSNMYLILVGPPGVVKKSTTINIGTALLRKVPNVHFGADSATWQKMVEDLEAAEDMFAEGDPSTVDLMNENHTCSCAMTLSLSEWGNLINPEDPEMINLLTELWDCRVDVPFRKATKTQGDNVLMNPFLNMIAATTPKWMQDNFRGKFGGWGFSSRCIFLHCLKAERHIAYPDELWGETYKDTMASFERDLCEISKLQGVIRLTPEARDFGRAWNEELRTRHETMVVHPHHDEWLSYYLARKFDHVHKLAIVLSVSQRDDLVITADDLREAIMRCDEVENELSLVFSTKQTATRDAKLNMDVWNGIRSAIETHGRIASHQYNAFAIRYMNYGQAKALLDHLVSSRWLVRVEDAAGAWLMLGPSAEKSTE